MQFDAGARAQQPQVPPGQPVRIGHPITVQPFLKIFGFADLKNIFLRIAHQVNAGAFGQLPEKILAQPLDQRSRIEKQQCLGRRHGIIKRQ